MKCRKCAHHTATKVACRWQCDFCGAMESDHDWPDFKSAIRAILKSIVIDTVGGSIPASPRCYGWDEAADVAWVEVLGFDGGPAAPDHMRYRRYTVSTGQWVRDDAGVRAAESRQIASQRDYRYQHLETYGPDLCSKCANGSILRAPGCADKCDTCGFTPRPNEIAPKDWGKSWEHSTEFLMTSATGSSATAPKTTVETSDAHGRTQPSGVAAS